MKMINKHYWVVGQVTKAEVMLVGNGDGHILGMFESRGLAHIGNEVVVVTSWVQGDLVNGNGPIRMKMVPQSFLRLNTYALQVPNQKPAFMRMAMATSSRVQADSRESKAVHPGRVGKSPLFPMRQRGTGSLKVIWCIPCHPNNPR